MIVSDRHAESLPALNTTSARCAQPDWPWLGEMNFRIIVAWGMAYGIHTLTRESQDVMDILKALKTIVTPPPNEVWPPISIVGTDIPFSGQLNITNSTLSTPS
jgi:hypothetical protein